jgi:hypothetical protein
LAFALGRMPGAAAMRTTAEIKRDQTAFFIAYLRGYCTSTILGRKT